MQQKEININQTNFNITTIFIKFQFKIKKIWNSHTQILKYQTFKTNKINVTVRIKILSNWKQLKKRVLTNIYQHHQISLSHQKI
jgi:hypothetical protein